jgi:hypothetical protein
MCRPVPASRPARKPGAVDGALKAPGSDETVSLGCEVGLKRIPAITDPGSNNGVRQIEF